MPGNVIDKAGKRRGESSVAYLATQGAGRYIYAVQMISHSVTIITCAGLLSSAPSIPLAFKKTIKTLYSTYLYLYRTYFRPNTDPD